jgi:hypothetical protein
LSGFVIVCQVLARHIRTIHIRTITDKPSNLSPGTINMLALSLGIIFVLGAVAALLADMEKKRRLIVELVDLLTPLVDRNRRLAMSNLRRLSNSPVQAYGLIDPIEREIGLLEKKNEIPGPEDVT